MPDYRDSRGNRIRLGDEVGSGGEGAVYRVQGNRGQVAKIWHNPTPRTAEKIAVMVRRRPATASAGSGGGGLFGAARRSRAHAPFAWPDDVLYDDSNQVVGFLMPYVDLSQFRESQAFFNPTARRRTERELNASFGDADLLSIARNLAEAVRQIHAAGHVIGDVNEKNVLVNARSDIMIVDIDAIQISDPDSGRLYRCTVGREDYTPARLQGVPFRDHDRGPDDDLFGLSVLIFKLIMGGMHPYTIKLDPDDEDAPDELGTRIKSGYFPYSEDHTIPDEYKQKVPQYIRSWEVLRDELKYFFRVSFDPLYVGDRPRHSPEEWVQALDRSIQIARQQGRRAPKASAQRGSQPQAQTAAPSQAAPTTPPQTGQGPTQPAQTGAPAMSRTMRLLVAAGVVGAIAAVASCAFLGGLAPVIGSLGAGASPPALPTSIPVVAAVEPTATPTVEPTPTDTPAPTETPTLPTATAAPPTPDISAMVAATVAAIQPTATPTPLPTPTPTLPPPTSTPVPTATPIPPTPTPTRVPYPDPVLMEQRGSLPSQLGRARGIGQYVAGCFVGSEPRQDYWIYLADRPSATLENARNPILLQFHKTIPKDELREVIPGECYYVGPILYRSDLKEFRCPDAVYSVACDRETWRSRTFPMYDTDRPLHEITEPPDFSN